MAPKQKIDAQRGVVAVEFSMVLMLFLIIAVGVIELARAMYLYNTLEMVTQRAASLAANTDFRDAAAMDAVRQKAIFRSSAGALMLGAPITDAHVRIDYLALTYAGTPAMAEIPAAALPACTANNRITCMKDPYDASCIRFVRARICDPAVTATCNHVQYQTLFSLVSLPLSLPNATAIINAETLGATLGAAPCP
ncbi:pilus assembly protein [Rugamonas sp. A1-17]|nr:pilus assembly protein [Rugamonas sp. A1-17]